MNLSKSGIMATAFSALLLSMGAMASDLGTTGAMPGPGGGDVPVVNPGTGGGCWFSYHIRKTGPEWARTLEDITYKIVVRNIGNCDLRKIHVTDFLPEHTKFVSANPKPEFVKDEKIVWRQISLEEGEKAVFEVTVQAEDRDHPDVDRFRITNTGCAFTPLIGTRICDTASTWVKEREARPLN